MRIAFIVDEQQLDVPLLEHASGSVHTLSVLLRPRRLDPCSTYREQAAGVGKKAQSAMLQAWYCAYVEDHKANCCQGAQLTVWWGCQ